MKLVTCGFLLYSSAGGSDSRCCLIQEWPKSDADVFFSLHNSSALLSNCSCTEIIIFMSMRYTFTVLWKRILCCMHPVRSWVSMNPKACGMIHPINLEKKKIAILCFEGFKTCCHSDVIIWCCCHWFFRSQSLLSALACAHVVWIHWLHMTGKAVWHTVAGKNVFRRLC